MAIACTLVPEELGLRDPVLIGAFMGWPDASLGASGAVRYLVESLSAAPLATWDGDEYYDFVELRPVSRIVPPRDRTLIWPQAEFWVAREVPVDTPATGSTPGGAEAPAGGAEMAPSTSPATRSLILCLAWEPRLRWRAYSRELAAFARRCGTVQAAFLGSAYADVPHTRAPIVTGWATDPRLRSRLEAQGVPFSAYQGPSSVQSAAIEACREAGIPSVSLFGNGPSYLTIPNANLSAALLQRLARLLDLRLDLSALVEAGETFSRQVAAAIEERSDSDFREHLRRLESRYDEQATPLAPGELRRQLMRAEEQPESSGAQNIDPQDVVRELEDFLRRRARQRGTEDAGAAGNEPEGGTPGAGQEKDGEDEPPAATPGHGPGV